MLSDIHLSSSHEGYSCNIGIMVKLAKDNCTNDSSNGDTSSAGTIGGQMAHL